MDEIEFTYLAKYLPEGLASCEHKEVIDGYVPSNRENMSLRIRRIGDKFEITKKEPKDESNISEQVEQTIPLNPQEYDVLMRAPVKQLRKIRYYYDYQGKRAEFNVFQGALGGLVVVEVEFKNTAERDAFAMPDFCIVEITNEDFIAGGMLAGKSYADIEPELARFNYEKLKL